MGAVIKKVGRNPLIQRALAAMIAGSIGAVKATTHWTTTNGSVAKDAWAGQQPVIVAFWHNRLAMMPMCWPSDEPFHMLISSHPDGQLIARSVAHFGIQTVAGSSTRGGSEALRKLVRKLSKGESVGITPDGPRGPRMRASDGAVTLARLSGAPILPASISVSGRKVLGTWDQLIVPFPLGRGAMIWGDPISVPRDASDTELHQIQNTLEDALNTISAKADQLMGHAPMTAGAQESQSSEKSDARS